MSCSRRATSSKAAGITPFTYGTGARRSNGGFYPYYDVSYLMMYLAPDDWKKLYNGQTPVDRSRIVQAQFDKWASLLKTKGCTNRTSSPTASPSPSSRPARPR